MHTQELLKLISQNHNPYSKLTLAESREFVELQGIVRRTDDQKLRYTELYRKAFGFAL